MIDGAERRDDRRTTIAWFAMGFLVLFATGCVRPDWIDQTLVTVDVTGVWRGTFERAGGGGSMELTLQQSGLKVTGMLKGTIQLHYADGPIEGTVNGDRFRFRSVRSVTNGELQVNGDEMTGSGSTQYGPGTMSLRRQQ